MRHPLRFTWSAAFLITATLSAAALSSTEPAGAASVLSIGEAPGAAPTSIFPLAGCEQDSLNNVQEFQDLMFRPLYWYGLSGSTALQPSLSPAAPPTANAAGTVVTVSMKGWRFADGGTVDAESVAFFLNLVDADPSAFCNAEVGRGIPGALRAVRASGETLTLTFATPVNLDWLTGNDLSNVVPLDPAWDRTATSNSAGCATGAYGAASTLTACQAVAAYLQAQGTSTSTFAHALWQGGVDGPWRLTSFTTAGEASFAANPRYSGPVRAHVNALRLIPFSSNAAEEAALANGSLSMGTVPASYVPFSARANGPNAASLAARDTLEPATTWSFNGLEVNFQAQGTGAALVNQLYVRAALQQALDQSALISGPLHGYGTVGVSPLPSATPTSVGTVTANPYPYSTSAARTALSSHGWTVENDQAVCTSAGTAPSECGAGIAAGTPLTLSVAVASGDPVLDQELALVRSQWSAIGVSLDVAFVTAEDVATDCASPSAFELCWSGQGWDYLSDYFPSGDVFFGSSPATSLGGYVSATMTKLIDQSLTRRGSLSAYATYAASQLPVIYLPTSDVLWEVSTRLVSIRPLRPNPLSVLTPEYWNFS